LIKKRLVKRSSFGSAKSPNLVLTVLKYQDELLQAEKEAKEKINYSFF